MYSGVSRAWYMWFRVLSLSLSRYSLFYRYSRERTPSNKSDLRNLPGMARLPFLQNFTRKSVTRSFNRFIRSRCFSYLDGYLSLSRHPRKLWYSTDIHLVRRKFRMQTGALNLFMQRLQNEYMKINITVIMWWKYSIIISKICLNHKDNHAAQIV